MTAVLQFAFEFNQVTCGVCHIAFAIPTSKYRKCSENGAEFWCPNGHNLVFTETEKQKLLKQLEQEKKRTKWAEESRDNYRADLQNEQRKRSALKGVLTKVKKRVGHGVCPCCQRTFQQLARHMNSKHPDYVKEDTK